MFDRNLMKLQGMGGIMGALVVLALLQAACIVGQAFTLSGAVSALWEGTPLPDVLSQIVAFFVCFALLQVIRFGQETMLDRFSLAKASELRAQLLCSAFDPSDLLARRMGAAAVADAATQGTEEIQTYIRIIPPKMIGMVAVSVPLLVVEFTLDWPSGIVLAIMFPVIIFFMILLGRQARDRAERQYASYTRLTNRFMDTLRGMGVIRAFGALVREGRSTYEQSEELRRATVATMTTATLSSVVLDLCATFGSAAVAIMLAFRMMDGSVDLATGLAALVLAPEYFNPIRSFASDYHASLDGKNALHAVMGMLEGAAGGTGAEDRSAEVQVRATQPAVSWDESATLELRNVTYRYGGAETGIGPISLAVSGFAKLGIVGASGSGKSTLADLVAGFVQPSSGEVLVNGRPADLTDPSWRSQVRYIPQSPYIFHASFEDNVRFYRPDATSEEVLEAISAVGLDELVEQLPDGVRTIVGEGGRGLSGGEAHRVALARILLDDAARVLVFDEPTAHLDIETELELKERMLPLMEGRLVVFATHRLHWTENMDRTVRLDSGAVADDGEVRR